MHRVLCSLRAADMQRPQGIARVRTGSEQINAAGYGGMSEVACRVVHGKSLQGVPESGN